MKYFYLLPTGRSGNFGAIRMSFDKLLEVVDNHLEETDQFILLLDNNEIFGKCTQLTKGTLKQIKEYINNESNEN